MPPSYHHGVAEVGADHDELGHLARNVVEVHRHHATGMNVVLNVIGVARDNALMKEKSAFRGRRLSGMWVSKSGRRRLCGSL